ncbi:MAG: apolipoprotein N-acyltransferase [Rickettsiales bacterium]|nr:apolipoprotein N-acyltransferase [Rickettsiales bacterium]
MQSRLLSLTQKQKYCVVAFLGAISALSFAPVFWFPILFISVPGLLFIAYHAQTTKEAFKLGLVFGFFHFVCGIYWVTFSILTQADKFWWLVPFAVTGMSAILSLYIAIPLAVSFRASNQWVARVFIFSGLWVIGELLRGYFKFAFTLYGFPWNLMGYSLSFSLELIQFSSIIGIYGLSLITIVIVSLPVLLVVEEISNRIKSIVVLVSVMTLSLMWAWGANRISNTELTDAPGVTLKLVQSGIHDHHDWDPKKRSQVVLDNMTLSKTTEDEEATHIIWSESSLPYVIDDNSFHVSLVSDVIPENGLLFTGSMRVDAQSVKLYSTIHAIDDEGAIVDIYDKIHLVPFGEYIPFRKILPFIDSVVGGTDFSAGDKPQTFIIDGLPHVSPLICYDVIFPHSIYDPEHKPDWLLNVTNDAWFKKYISWGDQKIQISSGPYQHYEMARMRAVENGMSMVRTANTGISAVIDPLGRDVVRMELGAKSSVNSSLPLMSAGKVVYGNYKVVIDVIIFIVCCFFVLVFSKKTFIIK